MHRVALNTNFPDDGIKVMRSTTGSNNSESHVGNHKQKERKRPKTGRVKCNKMHKERRTK